MARAVSGIYGGVSADQRRTDRRRRLMDAALDLTGTHGLSATTIRGVCERARVGPRFFYESFEDLDSLTVAVLDEIVRDALDRALEAMAAAHDDRAAKTRAAVETIVGELIDDPRRARIVFAESRGSEALAQRRFAAMRAIADVVAAQARILLELPPHSERLVAATSLVLTGGIADLVLAWLDDDVRMTREELIDICVELLDTTAQSVPGMARRLSGDG